LEFTEQVLLYPRVRGMELTKHTDTGSSQLCHYFFSGKTMPQVQIVMTTNQGDNPYLTYTLYNVMIGRFNRFHDATLQRPIETLELSYTKLEEKFVPYDAAQRSGTPVATGYDLSTAQVM
jgi:type VI secretion system secreted protein Hcp